MFSSCLPSVVCRGLMSCCLHCLCLVVSNTCCIVFYFFVLCAMCCQFLWIVHVWLPLRCFLTFIEYIFPTKTTTKCNLTYLGLTITLTTSNTTTIRTAKPPRTAPIIHNLSLDFSVGFMLVCDRHSLLVRSKHLPLTTHILSCDTKILVNHLIPYTTIQEIRLQFIIQPIYLFPIADI